MSYIVEPVHQLKVMPLDGRGIITELSDPKAFLHMKYSSYIRNKEKDIFNVLFWKTGFQGVAQAGFELTILLFLPERLQTCTTKPRQVLHSYIRSPPRSSQLKTA